MNKKLKIALTGVGGQLGWELQRTLSPLGQVFASDFPTVDLSNPQNIRQWLDDVSPDICINPAAYTAVDQAEDDEIKCFQVNSLAPSVMAEEMEKRKGVFIHYSTDYVFSGKSSKPYCEEDSKSPLSVYGTSKLDGEKGALANSSACLIFRTSWVYSLRGKNFLLTIKRLLNEKKEIKIVDDQIGSPTWARLLAESTSQIVSQGMASGNLRHFVQSKAGVYHMTNGSQTSWYGFAQAIKSTLQTSLNNDTPLASVLPIPTKEFPTKATRPFYSVLDNSKLQNAFGLHLPNWEEALALCLGS